MSQETVEELRKGYQLLKEEGDQLKTQMKLVIEILQGKEGNPLSHEPRANPAPQIPQPWLIPLHPQQPLVMSQQNHQQQQNELQQKNQYEPKDDNKRRRVQFDHVPKLLEPKPLPPGGAEKDKPKVLKQDKVSTQVDTYSSDALEEHIRQELVPANKINVTFSDIGALDDVKESLQEAVMLPLRRPDLFKGNGILKPCKGVLLFGPPGTGKTMLAKAIAKESGASFINVSSSTIQSMWYGQSEKNVRALFSVAAKVAPTIIFIDEVDSMFGQRSTSEPSPMRRVKNEFMSRWDGLLSNPDDKIIVLGATNKPFYLDDAIIRRFQCRIMVGLPSAENRETILKTLLANEKHDDIDFKEISTMTEGYSGSDLKNLCMTAAYRPLKELLQQEKEKEMKIKKKVAEAEISKDASNDTEKDQAIALRPLNMEDQAEVSKDAFNDTEEDQVIALKPLNMEDQAEISKDASNATQEDKEDQVIALRPLNMEDMRQAKNKVAASFSAEGSIMKRLKEWNNLYGEGGSRKNEEQLSYFL